MLWLKVSENRYLNLSEWAEASIVDRDRDPIVRLTRTGDYDGTELDLTGAEARNLIAALEAGLSTETRWVPKGFTQPAAPPPANAESFYEIDEEASDLVLDEG